MASRTTRFIARSGVAAVLLAAGAAQANLVTNGGFETGDFSGWTVSSDPVFDGVDTGAPHDGSYAAFFGNPGTSTIKQTIATVAGSYYKVSFWLQLESDVTGVAAPNAFSYDFGSYTGQGSLVNAAAFGYTEFDAIFTASGPTTDLAFHFSDAPAFWDLDSVSVTLPEPGSIALLAAAGLAGILACHRRRVADTSA
jgi:hypothetical protein